MISEVLRGKDAKIMAVGCAMLDSEDNHYKFVMGHVMNILTCKNLSYNIQSDDLNTLLKKLEPEFPQVPDLDVKFTSEVDFSEPFLDSFNMFKANYHEIIYEVHLKLLTGDFEDIDRKYY